MKGGSSSDQHLRQADANSGELNTRSSLNFLSGGGAAGRAIAALEWAASPIGGPEEWPQSLRTVLGTMLHSEQPQLLVWGDDRVVLYNDASRSRLDDALTHSFGRPFPPCRTAGWRELRPLIEAAYRGKGSLARNIQVQPGRYVSFDCAPIFAEGGKVGGAICTIVEDRSAGNDDVRREVEWCRELFGSAPTFLAILRGPEHRFEVVNDAFCDVAGRRQIVGKTLKDAMPEVVEQGFYDLIDKVYRTGEPYVGRGVRADLGEREERRERFFDFVYQPIRNEDGQIEGVMSHGFDVTEEHRARRRAELLHKELVRASGLQAMLTMAASVARELNQPLTAARSYLGGVMLTLQKQAIGHPDLFRGIEGVADQIRRATDMIRRIRDMGLRRRPMVGAVTLEPSIANVLELIGHVGIGKGVDIRVDLDRRDLAVCADPAQVEQVLFNLVKNACEAVAGSAVKTVRIAGCRSGDAVTIRVEDSGPGMTCELEDARCGTFKSAKADGLGIGLALSVTIVETFGGSLKARNLPGGGACLEIELPSG